jgi:hypothetical protein
MFVSEYLQYTEVGFIFKTLGIFCNYGLFHSLNPISLFIQILMFVVISMFSLLGNER